jgi:16S rRNA processing protein RimM
LNRADDDLLAVGRVEKAFGIRGEVIVSLMTDSPERFRVLKQVLVGRAPAGAHPMIVEQVSVGPRGVRLKFAGTDSRDAAEALVGEFLFVDARHRVRPANGRHFVHELVGLSVVDEQGSPVGTVREVLKLPAHDVYVIDRAGREVMIPAVKEFIRSIDRDARTMTVRLIEGMLDEV